jgi:uncharacterized protein (DUF2252 family)
MTEERRRTSKAERDPGQPRLPTSTELRDQLFSRPTAERMEMGVARRESCKRRDLATWEAPADRPDPVDILIESSKGRVEELIPIRYGRMLATPFTFYRGGAAIMASDLSRSPSPGIRLWACGDAHLLNFGAFATPERKMAFDINDFDETAIAPFDWDVKRLVASFVVAGRSNGFSAADTRAAAVTAARTYRERMAEFAATPVLDVWYSSLDPFDLYKAASAEFDTKPAIKRLQVAAERSAHAREYAKLAYQSGDHPRIKDDPPLLYHPIDFEDESFLKIAEQAIKDYAASLPTERLLLIERFKLADVAMKVVGVGSVGTFCGVALMMSGAGDPLFLQFKEARASVLEPYNRQIPHKHHGERVVIGQRLMQSASDIFLGWFTGSGAAHRHFYMRQLRDAKVTPLVDTFDPLRMKAYAAATGMALARAHARSGDAAMLSGYMGTGKTFDEALATFGERYADQNERDHAKLLEAVRDGRIEARPGV